MFWGSGEQNLAVGKSCFPVRLLDYLGVGARGFHQIISKYILPLEKKKHNSNFKILMAREAQKEKKKELSLNTLKYSQPMPCHLLANSSQAHETQLSS